MPDRTIAVLTDSLSPKFYFPLWYQYYSTQFSSKNIHLMTLSGKENQFCEYPLGSVMGMGEKYDDDVRLARMTERVSELLQTYDYVVRVDTDEFLVADPNFKPTLAEYINALSLDYVTARGFDIFQHPSEPQLLRDVPILVSQRKHAFALTAMNKTCITAKPLKWNRGFHYCSEMPRFDKLYLFHLKRADITALIEWNKIVSSTMVDDSIVKAYYDTPAEKIVSFHEQLSRRSNEQGENAMDRIAFNEQFFSGILHNEKAGVYDSKNYIDTVNVIIPDKFQNCF
jgi:hypothetical protein